MTEHKLLIWNTAQQQQSKEAKGKFFEKFDNIDKPLATWISKKRGDTGYQYQQ